MWTYFEIIKKKGHPMGNTFRIFYIDEVVIIPEAI